MGLIKKYNPEWADRFQSIKQVIDEGLAGLANRIEHVGSTSVPGLDAKDIIDLDIIYEEASEFGRIHSGLEALGYFHNGDQGIPGREAFKRSGNVQNEVLDSITHHLYVCMSNSKALERHLLFRDHLRWNAEARSKYQKMKYAIAKDVNQNKEQYAEQKELRVNDFIDAIIDIEKERKA